MGDKIVPPDYDQDGQVSFEEAHAYTVLTSETIDLPVKTSGEYLSEVSRFDEDDERLLKNDAPYSTVLKLASPVQRTVLEGLSKKLNLKGEKRLVDAWEKTRAERGRNRSRRVPEVENLRRRIAGDLRKRWPSLANLMNPEAIRLLTTDQEVFVNAVEGHSQYKRYVELKAREDDKPDDDTMRALHDRFLRVADNVLLAENLRRLNRPDDLERFPIDRPSRTRSVDSGSS